MYSAGRQPTFEAVRCSILLFKSGHLLRGDSDQPEILRVSASIYSYDTYWIERLLP